MFLLFERAILHGRVKEKEAEEEDKEKENEEQKITLVIPDFYGHL